MVGYKRAVKLKTKIRRRDERIAQLEKSKKRMQIKVHHLDGEMASLQALIAGKNTRIEELEQANSKLLQDLEDKQ